MIVSELFGLDVPNKCLDRRFICGVEYEIESIKEQRAEGFFVEVDNSLRNNGLEFKSPPHTYEESLAGFKYLHGSIKTGPNPFSDRTSIHVHVNCSQLTPKEVREFILLYALFEPIFFEFVGPVRQGSIFCVPLYYTYLPSQYKGDIKKMHAAWHKYTAFNICPLGPGKDGTQALGTIEFRHLYGTDNYEVFETWLSAIKELYEYIATTDNFSIIEQLKAGDTPYALLCKAIPTFAKKYSQALVNHLCEDTIIDVKLSTGGLK